MELTNDTTSARYRFDRASLLDDEFTTTKGVAVRELESDVEESFKLELASTIYRLFRIGNHFSKSLIWIRRSTRVDVLEYKV